MNVEAIAIVAAVLFVALAIFQVAIALGLPAGDVVNGGKMANADGTLPPKWRAMSAIAALILLGFAWVILARGGVVSTSVSQSTLAVGSWAIVAYTGLNTAMNFMSTNKIERYVMGGTTGVLVILCSIVAASGPA